MSNSGDFKDISGKPVNLTAMFAPDTDMSLQTISGFWRRIAALIVDGAILAILGAVIGVILGDRAYTLGPWGLLLGCVISILYFGLLNSYLSRGQTLGKKLLKIKVVTIDGHGLSLPKSFVRAVLLVFPLFISQYPHTSVLLKFLTYILLISLFYFYFVNQKTLFNEPTRQTYYDMLLGSYVVNRNAEGKIKTRPFWRGHLAVVAFILFFIYNGTLAYRYMLGINLTGMDDLYTQLLQIEDAYKVTVLTEAVSGGLIIGSRAKDDSPLLISLTKVGAPHFEPSDFNQIAELVFTYYPQIKQKGALYVEIKYEYNIGFMRWSRSETTRRIP